MGVGGGERGSSQGRHGGLPVGGAGSRVGRYGRGRGRERFDRCRICSGESLSNSFGMRAFGDCIMIGQNSTPTEIRRNSLEQEGRQA